MESISASVSAGHHALVAPGPEVTSTTPGCRWSAHSLRPHGRALLVAHQDVLDVVLLENLVIDRQHRAAGIAEDMCSTPWSFSACSTISAPVISKYMAGL
jgi:hypothetical protein